jgi:hypothetical protein
MGTIKANPPKFRLGDWVKFQYGVRPVYARIIEDRGPLGAGRRRLYRIRFDQELDQELSEPVEFEMPEDEMEKAVPDRSAILRYLKQGGLIEILRANLSGGKDQPCVWLTYNRRGELSYTYTQDRGLVGSGACVPSWALHENKILPDKRPKVLAFLKELGLAPVEAEEVMEAVGTGGPSEVRHLRFR